MRSWFFVTLISFLFLVGCSSVKPVGPNIYDVPGCPTFKMADEFEHVGNPKLSVNARCTGIYCRPLNFGTATKTWADLYVSAPSGKELVEVCLFTRDILIKSHSYWAPEKGQTVDVKGREFVEYLWFYELTEEGASDPIESHLGSLGYTANSRGFLVYSVVRNVNQRIKLSAHYAFNYDHLPVSVKGNEDKYLKFMRGKFQQRIAL